MSARLTVRCPLHKFIKLCERRFKLGVQQVNVGSFSDAVLYNQGYYAQGPDKMMWKACGHPILGKVNRSIQVIFADGTTKTFRTRFALGSRKVRNVVSMGRGPHSEKKDGK